MLDDHGHIHSGCNVENSSYGLTQCAERNALAAAVSAGVHKGRASVILIYATGFDVLTPCGACRQVLHDFGPDMRVMLANTGGAVRVTTLRVLLPDAFMPDRVLAHMRSGEPRE